MVPSFLLLSFFSPRELMYKRTGFEARIVFKRVSYFLKILVVVVKQVGVLLIH